MQASTLSATLISLYQFTYRPQDSSMNFQSVGSSIGIHTAVNTKGMEYSYLWQVISYIVLGHRLRFSFQQSCFFPKEITLGLLESRVICQSAAVFGRQLSFYQCAHYLLSHPLRSAVCLTRRRVAAASILSRLFTSDLTTDQISGKTQNYGKTTSTHSNLIIFVVNIMPTMLDER